MDMTPRYLPDRTTWHVETALMIAIGIFFALTGLYNSDQAPAGLRFVYWVSVMVLGGIVTIAFETALLHWKPEWAKRAWLSLFLVSLLATTPQTLIVAFFEVTLFNHSTIWPQLIPLWVNVAIVIIPMVALLRALRLITKPQNQPVESRSQDLASPTNLSPPPLISQHLGAQFRKAPLIALQAEDHYVRVHTKAGSDLVLLRFVDALTSVEDRKGFRLHRSWWVSEEAIKSVQFSRGSGEVLLKNDVSAPLSRTYAPDLKQAGWF